MKREKLVHHHFLYYAAVGRADMDAGETTRQKLEGFLSKLVVFLQMDERPKGNIRYDSENDIWVGKILGGMSHAIFHYFLGQKIVQIDLYCLCGYQKESIMSFLDSFRESEKLDFLCINKHSPELSIMEG